MTTTTNNISDVLFERIAQVIQTADNCPKCRLNREDKFWEYCPEHSEPIYFDHDPDFDESYEQNASAI